MHKLINPTSYATPSNPETKRKLKAKVPEKTTSFLSTG